MVVAIFPDRWRRSVFVQIFSAFLRGDGDDDDGFLYSFLRGLKLLLSLIFFPKNVEAVGAINPGSALQRRHSHSCFATLASNQRNRSARSYLTRVKFCREIHRSVGWRCSWKEVANSLYMQTMIGSLRVRHAILFIVRMKTLRLFCSLSLQRNYS